MNTEISSFFKISTILQDRFSEKINKPEFVINLQTEEVGKENANNVQFVCSQEELQVIFIAFNLDVSFFLRLIIFHFIMVCFAGSCRKTERRL